MDMRTQWNGKPVRRMTDLGVEKLCPGCNDWWPQDSDFYSFISARGHFHSRCKACNAADKSARQLKKKEAA